ncbi:hypothetical protein CHLNCDRAFT_22681 [Chlorella variabilis]|uniref:Uncharacterized protein n=1 Tax=Chlorella variabilis TaxID=554065 RepID=E1ZE38_CHLVA|nr:hypothetical protein CHLNCDRAFT_22681 [Chlorella variabilis]EFN55801.1 hypothetical protein CHLNCDRAFT_22681 [Chlorella variabilis]|eukprot:XP_005847903.1 hypothetical protein CHLNCDRAFT_22681 [Chlorella variabilis]
MQRRVLGEPAGSRRRKKGARLSPVLVLFPCGVLLFAGATLVLFSHVQSNARRRPLAGVVPPSPLGVPPPPHPQAARSSSRRVVWWHAPFFSGGGMGMEALQLVRALQSHTEWRDRVWITSHGDLALEEVYAGLPAETKSQVARMVGAAGRATMDDARHAIIVCHSVPGAWALPQPLFQTSLCPPLPLGQAAFVVGRAMFETDRLTPLHVERINQMSEVWVPTEFHRRTFTKSGVNASKVVVVPEAVDTHEFDPQKHRPLALPLGERVFGPTWPHPSAAGRTTASEPYVFLSIFKWETRKGWDVLLRAFLSAFTADDNVLLLLSTKPFHSDSNFADRMAGWARRELGDAAADPTRMPSTYVVHEHIAQHTWPRLYKTADCFVLPTRGEGWGLPVVEAMAMELPVVVTNWSGPTAYLDESVGYPLKVSLLTEVQEGAFKGHRWAQPSVEHLVHLLRHVAAHRQEAAARGRAARQRMASEYSPTAVGERVAQQLRRIDAQLLAGAEDNGLQ